VCPPVRNDQEAPYRRNAPGQAPADMFAVGETWRFAFDRMVAGLVVGHDWLAYGELMDVVL
jgi:hypothetical protein